MSIHRGSVRGLVRAVAYDVRGVRLGRVAQVFIDDRTDEPAWVAVDVTRTRGMRLLPLAGAGLKGRHLVIRAERTTVRSAPRIDLGDGQLSSQDESRLLEHYGLAPAAGSTPTQPLDQRPASPWSDDTERETAWERPTQPAYRGQDTQAISQGWQQPTGAPVSAPQPTSGSQITDQQTPGQPRHGSGEIGDRADSRDRGVAAQAPEARAPETAAPPAPAPAPAAEATMPIPSQGSAPPGPRAEPESQGSAPASPTR